MTIATVCNQDIVTGPQAIPGMYRAALRSLPNECCGVLIGKRSQGGRWHVVKVAQLANCHHGDRTIAFQINPIELVSVLRREAEWDHLGFFHSHPNGSLEPSPRDIADASPWPGYLQAIVKADGRGQSGIRFFLAGEHSWQPLHHSEPTRHD